MQPIFETHSMDRNQVIGLSLIAVILIGFQFLMQPSDKEIARNQRKRDSLEQVQKTLDLADKANGDNAIFKNDSNDISNGGQKEEKLYVLENENIKVQISSLGGYLAYSELLNYKSYDSSELVLTTPKSSEFSFIYGEGASAISTSDLEFKLANKSTSSLSLIAQLPNGGVIRHNYSLASDGYMLNFEAKSEGVSSSASEIVWNAELIGQEKSLEPERNATTIYFKEKDENADYLSETSEEDDDLIDDNPVEWVSFKQQFFNQTLIYKNGFTKADLKQSFKEENSYLKSMSARLTLPQATDHSFEFYIGPNKYETLNHLDIGLEKLIPLGWGIFGWVNKLLVIPVFNFLDNHIDNYGIIILILTVLIKVLLIFFTFKAFLSGAKMRALKPELDELKKKTGGDQQKMQMEQMKLYQATGVSPFGGCLPMILQFPFLIAMFRFFPASIELRQESFLWAEDLSTYDSIYDLGFNIPAYGDHISLFPILMTISTIFYTLINQSYQPTQQKELKYLPYFMPIIFLAVLNNYSSGLSYYYLLANIFSIGQTYLFKLFVDEKKLRLQIEENKNKTASGNPPAKKGMQARMQEWMDKQQNKAQISNNTPKKKR